MNAKLFTAGLLIAVGLSVPSFAQGVVGAANPMNANALTSGPTDLGSALAGFTGLGAVPYGNSSAAANFTVPGDINRSTAEIIKSSGEAIRNTSEAMINVEAARELYLDNAYKTAEVFWERRRLWSENAAAERGAPLSSEQLRQIAKVNAPSRLGALQLSGTGEINWPAALLRPEFEESRKTLEELFATRTVSNTGIGSTTEVAATRVANGMQEQLLAEIDDMTPNEYMAAKSFLRSLKYETRFMPGLEGVARR